MGNVAASQVILNRRNYENETYYLDGYDTRIDARAMCV
jgi:hypothetical protein